MAPRSTLGRAGDFLASVRMAVPLLVAVAAASILGSVIPQGGNVRLISSVPDGVRRLNAYLQLNDIFHSWWYLLLLALLGLSLVMVTVKRVPTVWTVRGRGQALGILLAHMGTIVILGGAIYGGLFGFRYYIRIIEGEAAVIPHLPMVIKLERLDLKYYAPELFRHRGPKFQAVERQESTLTLLHHGRPFLQGASSPGNPLSARGVALLPSHNELGWAFDVVLAAGGHEKVVTIRPWAPSPITLGLGNLSRIMAHRLIVDGAGPDQGTAAEIFLLDEGGTGRSLGFAARREPLRFGAWTISIANIRRYTGVRVYSRPEMPVLITGVIMLALGLGAYLLSWVTKGVHARGRHLTTRARAGAGEIPHVTAS